MANGVKIITKKSKLEKDKIYCYGVSKGGLSVVSDTDYPNADVAPIHQSLSGLSGFTAPQLKKLLDSKAINYSFELHKIMKIFMFKQIMKILKLLCSL